MIKPYSYHLTGIWGSDLLLSQGSGRSTLLLQTVFTRDST